MSQNICAYFSISENSASLSLLQKKTPILVVPPPLPVTDWSVVYIIFTPSYSILLETKTIASYTNMNPRNNKDLTRKRTRLCRLKSAVSSFNRVRSRTLKCVLQKYVHILLVIIKEQQFFTICYSNSYLPKSGLSLLFRGFISYFSHSMIQCSIFISG